MMTAADVLTQSAAAAGFAKILVDVCKLTFERMPRNYIPLVALALSECCSFLLVATNGALLFDRATISAVLLMGVGATAGAMAVSAAQTKADKVNERVDVALKLNDPNATTADVDREVLRRTGTGDGSVT